MSSIWNCTAYSKSGECVKGVYYKGGASKRVLIRDVVADHNCERSDGPSQSCHVAV